MQIQVGDKVKFLNEQGEGKVTKISGQIAHVLIEDGFEIPYQLRELIRYESPGQSANAGKQSQPAPPPVVKEKKLELSDKDLTVSKNLEVNLKLGLVPKDPGNIAISDINLYLVNDSNYGMYYTISIVENTETVKLLAHGALEDNTKISIKRFSQSAISMVKKFKIQAILFGKDKFKPLTPVEESVNIEKINFYRTKEFTKTAYFKTPAIVFDLVDVKYKSAINKLVNDGIGGAKPQTNQNVETEIEKTEKKSSNSLEEVDLHIEQITENYEGLSNKEILDIQVARFETTLEGAIKSKQKKVVYIHGLGNGKLKYEIRRLLDSKYSKVRYQDASFKEYGYGATMVLI